MSAHSTAGEIRVHSPRGAGAGASRLRPRVLVLQDFYLPGEKVGGPVWAVANMVEGLGDRFEFMIAALDRDFMSDAPYPLIDRENWNPVGKGRVFYASRFSVRNLLRLIRASAPDILYLNSFFWRSTVRALLLRRAGWIPGVPFVLAPHGEFSEGALQLKAHKKKAYLAFARAAGLCSNVLFHASTPLEESEIRKVMGARCRVGVAPEFPPLPAAVAAPGAQPSRSKPHKRPGELRLVFLSRITPKKNLLHALRVLRGIPGEVALDIFGPIEDPAYWQQCQREIARDSREVRCRYRGIVPHAQVAETVSRYHMFVLPTLGENFGYAILEALLAGSPVLISDRTPWRNLAAQQLGWDLPLNEPAQWESALREAVDMDQARYARFSTAASNFAAAWMNSREPQQRTMALLERALESPAVATGICHPPQEVR